MPRKKKVQQDDPHWKAIEHTARYAGSFLVAFGAVLTLMNINLAFSGEQSFALTGVSQVAQTTTVEVTGTSSSTDPTDPENTPPEEPYDPFIDILFAIPNPDIGGVQLNTGGTDVLWGKIDIKVIVDGAETVEVFLDGTQTTASQSLGNADYIGNRTWKLYFDTTNVLAGEYDLLVRATDAMGQHALGSDHIRIENDTAGESEPPLPAEPHVDMVVVENQPVGGSVRIDTFVEGAEKVTLFLNEIGTGDIFLGKADHKGGNEWRFNWESTTVGDGEYLILSKIYLPGGYSYTGASVEVFVENQVEEESTLVPEDETIINTDITETISEDTNEGTVVSDLTEVQPDSYIDIQEASPVSGGVDIVVQVPNALRVSIFARRDGTLSDYYLGFAEQRNDTEWYLKWDSTQTPNGSYLIYAEIKNEYGFYKGAHALTRVFNEIKNELSEEEKVHVEDVIETKASVDQAVTEFELKNTSGYLAGDIDKIVDTSLSHGSLDGTGEESGANEPIRDARIIEHLKRRTESLLEAFKEKMNVELDRLALSVRAGNYTSEKEIRQRLRGLKEETVRRMFEDLDADPEEIEKVKKRIDERMNSIIEEFEEETIRREVIVRDRVGEEVFKDSDSDGISDYDEVHLYKTDPFAADSDNDGFIDGTEILNGFDPKDDKNEVPIAYESPKETGTEREDLLVIESLTTETDERVSTTREGITVDDSGSEPEPIAILKGKALPNSFVTLYIFSTPIVVTARTDDEGAWTYRFDKELEDGAHEVYVGITDNAGKVIAKSRPFPFIKEAQAFTPVSASGSTLVSTPEEPPQLLNDYTLLAILSISVVAIGLVLMMIGMYVRNVRTDAEALV